MAELVVSTASGPVRGTSTAAGAVFLGIPYAAPPTGAARFDGPTPHPGWTEVRDATRPGPAAPQKARTGFGALNMAPYFGTLRTGEPDYLRVNVWAPRDATRRPVMVFVHGGGFVSGSTRSPLYDGSAFARDGVVLVTVTYRLGVVGFLDVPGAPPNRGLLDVQAALHWVQTNIAAFGGDPDNVTLFGQSAGATLVGALLATPGTGKLVQRAIMQSGNGTGAFDPEQADLVTRRAGVVLGAAPTSGALDSLSDDALVDLGAQLGGTDLRTTRRFDPLVGLSPFSVVMERQPADAVAAGVGSRIPLLIGTNADEGNLYLAPQGELDGSTESDVRELAARSHAKPDAVVADLRTRHPPVDVGSDPVRTSRRCPVRRRHATSRRRACITVGGAAAPVPIRLALMGSWRSTGCRAHRRAAVRLRLPGRTHAPWTGRPARPEGATAVVGYGDAPGLGPVRDHRRPRVGAGIPPHVWRVS